MRRIYQLSIRVLLAIVFFAGADRAMSQGIVTGSLGGTVQDPTSAVVQGATVTATQVGTNSISKTTTGTNGVFQLPGLPVGTYTVKVEVPGFAAVNVENVLVQAGKETPLGALTLKIGAAEAAVTVEAAAAILQPDSVQISQEFDTEKTANLPIGNGFDVVALLTPGVAPSGGNIFTNSNGAEFSSNGVRDRNNNF